MYKYMAKLHHIRIGHCLAQAGKARVSCWWAENEEENSKIIKCFLPNKIFEMHSPSYDIDLLTLSSSVLSGVVMFKVLNPDKTHWEDFIADFAY